MPEISDDLVTVLAGGVGAARMLAGIIQVVDPAQVTAIVNVGDDLELHGLRISPDLDTITYTLAGEINPETGWGLKGETWQAMDSVKRLLMFLSNSWTSAPYQWPRTAPSRRGSAPPVRMRRLGSTTMPWAPPK